MDGSLGLQLAIRRSSGEQTQPVGSETILAGQRCLAAILAAASAANSETAAAQRSNREINQEIFCFSRRRTPVSGEPCLVSREIRLHVPRCSYALGTGKTDKPRLRLPGCGRM